jgi:hypothetical protein
MDSRIKIRILINTKMSWIRNTGKNWKNWLMKEKLMAVLFVLYSPVSHSSVSAGND